MSYSPFLESVRVELRTKHYSLKTESYVDTQRYLLAHIGPVDQ
ncbi:MULTISPECIES: hypothetical protein [unclassified Pseudoalteromonas]|nr:hypothetical protein [Pseudoalteromonas sp. XMcav2-N]